MIVQNRGWRSTSSTPAQRFTPLVFLIVGLGLAGYSGYRLYEKYRFQQKGLKADAEVIRLNENVTHDSEDNRDNITYQPVLRFVSFAGDTVVTAYNLFSDPPLFDVGERVTVFYFPSDPKSIDVGFNQVEILLFGGLSVVGLIFFGIGVVKYVRGRV